MLLLILGVAGPEATPPLLASRLDVSRAHFPVDAVTHLQQRPHRGHLFAPYRWGGYLLWRLPAQPVFIDGRTNIYSSAIWRDYSALVTPLREWREVLDRWDITEALVFRYSPTALVLEEAGWEISYRDEEHEVLRPPAGGARGGSP